MANSRIYLKSEAGGTTVVSRDTSATSGNLVLPAGGNVASVDTAVTDNAIARYDSTTGKLQNSGVTIDDNNQLIIGSTDISSVWTNGSLGFHNTVGTTIRGKAGSVFDLSLYNAGGTSAILSHTPAGVVALNDGKLNIDSAGNVLVTSSTGGLGYGTGAGGTVTQLTSKSTAVTLNKPSGRITMNNSALAAGEAVYFTLNNNLLQAFDGIVYDGLYYFVNPQNYRIETNFVSYGYVSIRVTNISNSTLYDALEFSYKIIKGATA